MENCAKKILLLTAFVFILICDTVMAQTIAAKDLQIHSEPLRNPLGIISQLQPISFEYSTNRYKQLILPAGRQFGFTDDMKNLLPGVFTNRNIWYNAGKNNQQALVTAEPDMQKLIPVLVGAVKEQQAEIERLRAEIDQLKRSK